MHPGAEDPFRSSSNENEVGSRWERSGLYLYKTSCIKNFDYQVGGKKGNTWLDSLKDH